MSTEKTSRIKSPRGEPGESRGGSRVVKRNQEESKAN